MRFEKALLESIDEAFSLLGESPKEAVYYHLEKTFNIKRQDIPQRIDEFADAIERIFGNGAVILEIQIMKILFKKLGYDFKYYPKQVNLKFTDYVTALKTEKSRNKNAKEEQTKKRQQKWKKDSDDTKTADSSGGSSDDFSDRCVSSVMI